MRRVSACSAGGASTSGASTGDSRRRTAVMSATIIGVHTSSRAVTTSVVTVRGVLGGSRPAHQKMSGRRSQVSGSASTAHTGRSCRFWFASAQSKCDPVTVPVSCTLRR
ncbi:hypothetical protein GCM10023198_00210 [Promicromonospora umidemergens]|uniref:Uncharacterized protein n=1 Tax=Promicromonospora umidemergens TaxID=629679 RepID=A0ABP8WC92_9MICO